MYFWHRQLKHFCWEQFIYLSVFWGWQMRNWQHPLLKSKIIIFLSMSEKSENNENRRKIFSIFFFKLLSTISVKKLLFKNRDFFSFLNKWMCVCMCLSVYWRCPIGIVHPPYFEVWKIGWRQTDTRLNASNAEIFHLPIISLNIKYKP